MFMLLCCLSRVSGEDQELILKVEPLTESCFFEYGSVDDQIVAEYEVLDGGHGEFDISFSITDPSDRILVADFKKGGDIHRLYAKLNGSYKFCFDNTFSAFNTKTVYFEIDIFNNTALEQTDPFTDLFNETLKNVANINTTIRHVKEYLDYVEAKQKMSKVDHAKSRNLAEAIFMKVNAYSFVVLFAMIFTSLVQIFMVKGIFDEKSLAHRMMSFLDH